MNGLGSDKDYKRKMARFDSFLNHTLKKMEVQAKKGVRSRIQFGLSTSVEIIKTGSLRQASSPFYREAQFSISYLLQKSR